MKKNKTFDAAQFMRTVREQLSEKYWKHPEILKKEMKAIQKKYNFNLPTQEDQPKMKHS